MVSGVWIEVIEIRCTLRMVLYGKVVLKRPKIEDIYSEYSTMLQQFCLLSHTLSLLT